MFRLLPELRSAIQFLERDIQQHASAVGRAHRPFDAAYRDFSRGERLVPVNVVESDKAFRIEAELPGVTKEDISIELADERTVSIHGKSKSVLETTEKPAHKVWASERDIGEFHRTFEFPHKLAGEGIKADMKDGLLILEVPKSTDNGAKKVAIDWK